MPSIAVSSMRNSCANSPSSLSMERTHMMTPQMLAPYWWVSSRVGLSWWQWQRERFELSKQPGSLVFSSKQDKFPLFTGNYLHHGLLQYLKMPIFRFGRICQLSIEKHITHGIILLNIRWIFSNHYFEHVQKSAVAGGHLWGFYAWMNIWTNVRAQSNCFTGQMKPPVFQPTGITTLN